MEGKVKKRVMLVVVLCVILMAAGGCGEEERGNSKSEQNSLQGSDAVTGTETADVFENEELSDGSESFEADTRAIYQRFLNGEEPLYFREDAIFVNPDGEYRYQVEANSPYEFYEICNMINVAYNSGAPVNELSHNISYAYIDCGADGEEELAVLFHDLEDYYDSEDVTLVIKAVEGKLELCYLIQPYYREDWSLANAYGMVRYECRAGTGYFIEDRGYIDAAGVYRGVYSETNDYNLFYWTQPDGFSSEILQILENNVIVLKTYIFGEDEYSKEYYLLTMESQSAGEASADMDSICQAVTDVTGMEFSSYEEIQRMIADREAELGLTEEIKNGPEFEWISLGEESYDLIYGVESAPGVGNRDRAIEAFRRFLSDKGHFKEVLSMPMADGLAVNNDGMVDGFFIKDLDNDDIPELLIGMSDAGRSQYVCIYKFDKESGRLKKDHEIHGLGGWFGCDDETFETVTAVYPEFRNSLLFTTDYVNDRQSIGYNDFGQLVWFDDYVGISIATDIMMFWCDYENISSDVSIYTEDAGYDFDTDVTYYEVTGSRKDAEKALQGYRPFLFYDINQENIDKYVVEDYLGAGMEQYSQQDITDDVNRFFRLYEEYADRENLTFTGIFTSEYSGQRYNIDNLVQLGFEY